MIFLLRKEVLNKGELEVFLSALRELADVCTPKSIVSKSNIGTGEYLNKSAINFSAGI